MVASRTGSGRIRFNAASSAAGPSPYGPAAVVLGLALCLVIGWTMRERGQGSEGFHV